jgi:hypothetical protein
VYACLASRPLTYGAWELPWMAVWDSFSITMMKTWSNLGTPLEASDPDEVPPLEDALPLPLEDPPPLEDEPLPLDDPEPPDDDVLPPPLDPDPPLPPDEASPAPCVVLAPELDPHEIAMVERSAARAAGANPWARGRAGAATFHLLVRA